LSSLLSVAVKQLADVLRKGAEEQVDESKTKLDAAKELYDGFISDLLVTDFSYGQAYETAMQMFGSPTVRFAAVDGSLDQGLLSGLAVFWGGAYAATGTLDFSRSKPPRVEYATGFIERS